MPIEIKELVLKSTVRSVLDDQKEDKFITHDEFQKFKVRLYRDMDRRIQKAIAKSKSRR